MDVEGATFETKDETARKLLKGLEELPYLRGAQSGIHTELRRTLSQWRADRVRLCRVSGQSGYEQTDGKASADAMEPAWSPSLAADPDAGAQ